MGQFKFSLWNGSLWNSSVWSGGMWQSQTGLQDVLFNMLMGVGITPFDRVDGGPLSTIKPGITYADVNGVSTAFPVNTPTVNEDGCRTGGAISNLVWPSEDFSHAKWIKSNSVGAEVPIVTSNYAVAPNGKGIASRLQLDKGIGAASTDYSLFYQAIGATTLSKYIDAIWLKSNTGMDQYILLYNSASAVGKEVLVTSTWQRFELSDSSYKDSSFKVTTTPSLVIGLRGAAANTEYYTQTNAINTADILIWGAMLHKGTYPLPYIPTLTGPVTTVTEAGILSPKNGNTLDGLAVNFPEYFGALDGVAADDSVELITVTQDSATNPYATFSLVLDTLIAVDSGGNAAIGGFPIVAAIGDYIEFTFSLSLTGALPSIRERISASDSSGQVIIQNAVTGKNILRHVVTIHNPTISFFNSNATSFVASNIAIRKISPAAAQQSISWTPSYNAVDVKDSDYGVEMITDGGFDGDGSAWNTSIVTISDNKANYTSASGWVYIRQISSLALYAAYKVSFLISNFASQGTLNLASADGTKTYTAITITGNGVYSATFICDSTSGFMIGKYAGSFVGSIDNISITKVVPTLNILSYDGTVKHLNYDADQELLLLTDGTNTAEVACTAVAGQTYVIKGIWGTHPTLGASKMGLEVDGTAGAIVAFADTFSPGTDAFIGLENEAHQHVKLWKAVKANAAGIPPIWEV